MLFVSCSGSHVISGLLMASGFVKAEFSTCRHGRRQVTCRLHHKSVLLLVFGLILWKWMNGVDSLGSNQECRIGYNHSHSRVSQCLASIRKLGNRRSSEETSELFPETCPYSVYRKDRNIHGGGVMLLVHKDISHMPITELENDSESVWVKVFVNKTSHFVASWYRPPGSTSEEFQLFREQLDYIGTHHKGKKLPSVHVL